MGTRVDLDEGGFVDVHTRIKDMCKEARNRMGLTNQDIADRISEKFCIDSFSVNTVNNFFSDRSKATTIYTTGYICSVLDISVDEVFGIEHKFSTEQERELINELNELKAEERIKDRQIEYLETIIKEKDERLSQAHTAINHYRTQSDSSSGKIYRRMGIISFAMLVISLVFIISYLIIYDIGNPGYGIF